MVVTVVGCKWDGRKLGSGCIYFFKLRGSNTDMAATQDSWNWNSTVAV
jgi:hypothetical protein